MFKEILVTGRTNTGNRSQQWLEVGDQGYGSDGMVKTGRIVRVDQYNGDDTVGERMGAAFATLTAAKAVAISGDTIVVYPGTYEENDLLKDGVNWHFMPGATVSYTDPGAGDGYGIFDDRSSGAVTCQISGDGNFHYGVVIQNWAAEGVEPSADPPNSASIRGMFVVTEGDSDIVFKANNITMSSPVSCHAFLVETGTVSIDFNDVNDLLFGVQTLLGTFEEAPVYAESETNGVTWGIGECFVRGRRIKVSEYAVWPTCPAGFVGNANLWVEVDLLHNKGLASSCVYTSGLADTPTTWKSWIICKEIRSDASVFAAFSGNSGGRHYVIAEKIGGPIALAFTATSTAPGEYWINSQKISGNTVGAYITYTGNTATVHIDALHIEAASGSAITNDGGTLNIRAGLIKQASGVGVTHNTGTTRITSTRIDSTTVNSADNKAVTVAGTGLVLNNCTLLAPALAESVYAAAARTIVNKGSCANKAKHANVTVSVEAILVDAAVV